MTGVVMSVAQLKAFALPPARVAPADFSAIHLLHTDDPTDMRAFELALVAISADICYASAPCS